MHNNEQLTCTAIYDKIIKLKITFKENHMEISMVKKLQKSDYIFITAITLGIFYYVILLFHEPFLKDEPYYYTVPLRLLRGDSMIQHEWHLSQFSSFFQYIPAKLWILVKGSSDGIVLFFILHFYSKIIIILAYLYTTVVECSRSECIETTCRRRRLWKRKL